MVQTARVDRSALEIASLEEHESERRYWRAKSTQERNQVKSMRSELRSKMNLSEAAKNFTSLVDKVYSEGISVDLERDDKVIARLTPALPRSPLTVDRLNAFLKNLPPLADDAVDFLAAEISDVPR